MSQTPPQDFLKDFNKHFQATFKDKYASGKMQVLDLAEEWDLAREAYIFSVIKYLRRFQVKGNKIDLLKATHYVKRLYELNQ